MGPNEKLFKKEYSLELFKIAENDLLTAKVLSASTEVRGETVLFHVEQSVEKALKATLCYQEKPIPLTHDLYGILQKFDPENLPPAGFALHDLTPFATIRRYEEGNYIIDQNDITLAIKTAEDVIAWVKRILANA